MMTFSRSQDVRHEPVPGSVRNPCPPRRSRRDRPTRLWLVLLAWPAIASALTIEEAVEAAVENNPSLQAAMYRVDAARAATARTRAAYYPSVFVSGNITRTDNPTHAFMNALNQRSLDMNDPSLDFNDPNDSDNMRLTTGVRYRLYDGGQRRAAQRIMNLGIDAERHATEAVQNTLIYLVKESYYRALQARDQIGVHEASLKSLEESLRVARERFDAGAAIITDVLNLEVQVAQARENLIRAQHSLEVALSTLNTTIGVEVITVETLTHPAPQHPTPDTRHPTPDTQHATPSISDHPELRAAAVLLGIREQDVRRTRRAYSPTLNAFGTLDWDSDISSDFERSYMVGVMAEWELFDGFRRRGEVRESRALRAEAEAQYDQTRNELLLQLKQARTSVNDARERLAVAQASVENAERALAITREQYEQGAATLADLLTAQSGLTAMQMRQTAAHYDYFIAQASVDRALGTLVQISQ